MSTAYVRGTASRYTMSTEYEISTLSLTASMGTPPHPTPTSLSSSPLPLPPHENRSGFEKEKDFPVCLNSVIAARYLVTDFLGSAAFSQAIQAHDMVTGTDVCMKIIKNNKDFFDQSLDEVKLLTYINRHDPDDKHHILRLYDFFYHRVPAHTPENLNPRK